MDRAAGQAACAACGHRSPAGMRFCTRCGAQLASTPEAPEAAPAPPEAASAAVAPPAAPSAAPPRWTLDTPPANERWWRNPIVVAMAVVAALGGGGVASWQFFVRSSAPASAIRHVQSPSVPGAGRTETDPALPTPDEGAFIARLEQVLRRSSAGLRAARTQHDYAAAYDNRIALVRVLDGMDTAGQEAGLAHAYATLRTALAASARADLQHRRCACDETLPEDFAATDLKRRFARQFNPYARRHGAAVIDPDRI